ncbi:hypothetical protein V6N13_037334 [Hibiscus sabdariffa]
MVWPLGCRKLIIESDSKDAIRIVQQCHGCCGVNWLVLHIREALQRPWQVVVQFVSRTGNTVADRLAKMAHHASFETAYFEWPPWGCTGVLQSDEVT